MHEPLDTKRLREYLATGKLSERQSLDGIAMDESPGIHAAKPSRQELKSMREQAARKEKK